MDQFVRLKLFFNRLLLEPEEMILLMNDFADQQLQKIKFHHFTNLHLTSIFVYLWLADTFTVYIINTCAQY